MINKILIANRGEIAARIIRTCKEMLIPSVAIYSDADKDAPFVKMADEAVSIGGLSPAESYLDQEKVLQAAKRSGADAIHPGYGFLSENASFARNCREAGFIFIGPSPEAIEAMGSKIRAKEIMVDHKVPVVPGYQGEDQSDDTLMEEAGKIGFPLLVKASAGGGGKGMRVVKKAADLPGSLAASRREALAAFGDDTLLLEKYFESVRHIEVQVFGDRHGNVVHLFERECSIQRRHQKIIEEAPSPFVDAQLRERLGKAAVTAAKAIGYTHAGTVEFIVDPDKNFYFLEVNTRLQVEHPVTEMITGQDLVSWQVRVAEGHPLPLRQEELHIQGHAIECRIYAEDPQKDFQPATGKLVLWKEDSLLHFSRMDSGVASGQKITSFYDPMLAKLITHGPDRETAVRKMDRALKDLVALGVTTNRAFLARIVAEEDFRKGEFDTHYLERHADVLAPHPNDRIAFLAAAQLMVCLQRQTQRPLLPHLLPGWRNNPYLPQKDTFADPEGTTWTVSYDTRGFNRWELGFEGEAYEVELLEQQEDCISFALAGMRKKVYVGREAAYIFLHTEGLDWALKQVPRLSMPEKQGPSGAYTAPLPGQVAKVLVAPGASVQAGMGLIVINSMKMENTIYAAEEGQVEEIFVTEGSFVEADAPLVRLKVEKIEN